MAHLYFCNFYWHLSAKRTHNLWTEFEKFPAIVSSAAKLPGYLPTGFWLRLDYYVFGNRTKYEKWLGNFPFALYLCYCTIGSETLWIRNTVLIFLIFLSFQFIKDCIFIPVQCKKWQCKIAGMFRIVIFIRLNFFIPLFY